MEREEGEGRGRKELKRVDRGGILCILHASIKT